MTLFDRAQQLLIENGIDSWIIAANEDSDQNSQYLLGVGSHARHYIVINAQGSHTILSVEMEAPMIRKALNETGVDAEVVPYQMTTDLPDLLQPLVSKPKVALNFGEDLFSLTGTAFADYIRAGDFLELQKLSPDTQFVSAAPIIYALRSVKSEEEIAELRETVKATLEILEQVPSWTSIGSTEIELKAKIEYEFMKLGKPAFESIIANNANAADPHYNTGPKKIEPGVLLIDLGLKTTHICSDLTWTYWVGGEPTEEFIQAYQTIYDAKEECFPLMQAGEPLYLVDVKCRDYMASQGYDHEKLYNHGLGHSLGFETHDIGPRMNWKAPPEIVFAENMVYTNEPGLYWQGKWGIRLEDDVVIKTDGPERLSYIYRDPPVI